MDIKSIIKQVNEKTGLKAFVGSDEELIVRKIPFNIPQLDACIGGGIPCARISELVGEFSTGKSFLCQQLIRSAQGMELDTVLFNIENKYCPLWFAKTGVDVDKLVVIQGNVGERVFDSLIQLIKSNIGLVIIDSIAAMTPLAESEDEMEQQTIGLQARMLSKGFRKIIDPLSTSKTAVVFTNQLRSGIGTYATDTYPGGRSQYFYSSLTIHVRRGEWILDKNDDDIRRGFRVCCRTVKNTLAPPWRNSEMPFLFSGQIDIVATLCEMALDSGAIVKSGAGWYTLPDKMRIQGWEKLLDYYREDGTRLKELSEVLAGEE